MIISMLQKFINERNLSILELSKLSDVSRPSLTALASNKGKGIQFDTLEKLCRFFRVDISEMLVMIDEKRCFVEIDDLNGIDFSMSQKAIRTGTVSLSRNISFEVDCIIEVSTPYCVNIDLRLSRKELGNEDLAEFLAIFSSSNDIERAITEALKESVLKQLSDALMDQAPTGEIVFPTSSVSFW